VQQAMEITRQRGRVVVVGDVGLGLQRSPFYEKEIDFLISRSYGPGRYDPIYETHGQDYPYAYVRWTENRNMEEYLRLITHGTVCLDQIIDREFTIEKADQAYQLLSSSTQKPLAVLLSYPSADVKHSTRIILRQSQPHADRIGVALVGAGTFARSIHLPNLMKLKQNYQVRAVVDSDGVVAATTAKQYDAEIATTQFEDILDIEDINLVIICTRHNTHARLALQALRAGKHVFVEKPLAITEAELTEIEEFYNGDSSKPVLMTGFNRRFSPHIKHLTEITKNRDNPMIINYRMNAGFIPLDHWVHGPEGGGRNLGEACHIYDLFTHLTGSEFVDLSAQHIHPQSDFYSHHDNFITNITYVDGSVASLTYTAMGASKYPKEQMDVFMDGMVVTLNDYQRLETFGTSVKGILSNRQNKGHFEELRILADSIQNQEEWPIPFWQLVQTTRLALLVEKYLRFDPVPKPH
jgi:predicted dehydrogenase